MCAQVTSCRPGSGRHVVVPMCFEDTQFCDPCTCTFSEEICFQEWRSFAKKSFKTCSSHPAQLEIEPWSVLWSTMTVNAGHDSRSQGPRSLNLILHIRTPVAAGQVDPRCCRPSGPVTHSTRPRSVPVCGGSSEPRTASLVTP